MNEAEAAAKTSWPAWYFGPDGQSQIFHNEDEVPSGWEDHPSKVGGSKQATDLDAISDDDTRVDELMEFSQAELIEILDDHNDKSDDDEVEFARNWPKLKLSKTILANGVSYTPKSDD